MLVLDVNQAILNDSNCDKAGGRVKIQIVFILLIVGLASLSACSDKGEFNQKPTIISIPEGDFVVDGDQWIDLKKFKASQASILGAMPVNVEPWPDGILPIVFDKDIPT